MGFNAMRGSNTIMKGGFLDTNRTTGAFFRRNDTLRRFTGSGSTRRLTGTRYADMVGGRFSPGSSVFGGFFQTLGSRRKKADLSVGHAFSSGTGLAQLDNAEDIMRGLAKGADGGIPMPKSRPRLVNHLDPRSMFRMHSNSAMIQAPGMYSPIGAMARTIGGFVQHSNIGKTVMGEARAYRAAMSANINGTVGRGLLAEGGRTAEQVQGMLRHRAAGDDLEIMSGGFFAQLRAGNKQTILEKKIAARQAAGKDVTKLSKRLAQAQQYSIDAARFNNPGVDPFNTKQITLRELQAAQVNARTTTGKKATTALHFGSPATHRVGGPGLAKEAYFMEGVDDASKRIVNLSKTAGGGFEAVDELSGNRISLNNSVGSSLYGSQSPGYSANVLASQHRGQLTQRMHGYIQGATGYGRAGGLTGQALAGAQSAQRDMQMLMEIMEGRGTATRSGFATRAGKVADMRAGSATFQTTGRELLDDIAKVGADDITKVRKFC